MYLIYTEIGFYKFLFIHFILFLAITSSNNLRCWRAILYQVMSLPNSYVFFSIIDFLRGCLYIFMTAPAMALEFRKGTIKPLPFARTSFA